MLKHCGNYAAILTNYASFLHQNASAICQRTYIVGVKTWRIKNTGTLHTFCFLQISAGFGVLSTFKMLADSCWACSNLISVLSGPSDDVIQVNELNAIGTYVYMVLKLCSHGTQLHHTLFWKIPYYASIMPRFKSCRLCSNLCWHNISKSNPHQNSATEGGCWWPCGPWVQELPPQDAQSSIPNWEDRYDMCPLKGTLSCQSQWAWFRHWQIMLKICPIMVCQHCW